ncbi:MAG: trigger factor [Thermaceae bacterium]
MAEILERSGWRVLMRVEVPAETVQSRYQALLSEYQKRLRIPGFRPGKAPLKVVEARLGKAELLEDLKEQLVGETYPGAVSELKLIPVAARVVEERFKEGQAFVYVAEVETYPDVQLPDWRSLTLEAKPQEVTEEMVDKALEDLRARYAELVPVEREIQEKDHAFVETEEGAQFPIDLEKALPHVREALLGRRAGEEVAVPIKDEQGNTVRETKVKILEVKTLEYPGLDEEFAKTVGVESLEELRAKVRQSLEEEAKKRHQEALKEEFLDRVAQALEVEIPPSMLQGEEKRLLEGLAEDLARSGVSLERYLEDLKQKGGYEAFLSDLRKAATLRAKKALVKEKLAEELSPELSEEEWASYLQGLARGLGLEMDELKNRFGAEGLARLRAGLIQEKALGEAIRILTA